jgi:hypothetical protein
LKDATSRQLRSGPKSGDADELAQVNEGIEKMLRGSRKGRKEEVVVALMGMPVRLCVWLWKLSR